MGRADCHLILRALTGPLEECGDTGVVVSGDSASCFIALVDVLGHGPEARQSAIIAEEFLAGCADADLLETLQGLHRALRQGRGAVATLCRLDLQSGELQVTGVGNITARIFGSEHIRVLSRDGVIGYQMGTPRLHAFRLCPGDIVMLYSDGIRESFETHDCPGLLSGSARDICGLVMQTFSKGNDDASCLVLRYTS